MWEDVDVAETDTQMTSPCHLAHQRVQWVAGQIRAVTADRRCIRPGAVERYRRLAVRALSDPALTRWCADYLDADDLANEDDRQEFRAAYETYLAIMAGLAGALGLYGPAPEVPAPDSVTRDRDLADESPPGHLVAAGPAPANAPPRASTPIPSIGEAIAA